MTVETTLQLCERLLEGTLTAEDKARLEALVLHDADAKRAYVEYLHMHASLRGRSPDAVSATRLPMPKPRRRTVVAAAFASLAVLVIVFGALSVTRWINTPRPVATLVTAQGATWEGTSLPTAVGDRLPPGRLRLTAGLATLAFDSGAQVTLEAPSDFELVAPLACVLHSGALVARVSPEAHGFVVRSPGAVVVDHGTEFALAARANGDTRVDVLDGLVEASHIGNPKALRLSTGEGALFHASGDIDQDVVGSARHEPFAHMPVDAEPPRGDLVISSAQGRGQATFVVSQPHPKAVRPAATLLVKNTRDPAWQRKAYVAFDLGALEAESTVTSASLTLTAVPTGMGFASLVPDAVFNVFGLVGAQADAAWNNDMSWQQAPGNAEGGGAVDVAATMWLGRFVLPQGAGQQRVNVDGPALTQFLSQRKGQVASIIIVRETLETHNHGLVHGFAGNHHPTAPPPTLRLELAGVSPRR